jgi:uncharacterized damage-inducible protein DinB
MTVEEVRALIAYDEWANTRLLDAVAALDEEAQNREMGGSFGSLRALVAHVMGAEWLWLRRWKGEAPSGPPEWLGVAVPELRARLAGVEAERAAFVATLGEAELEGVVEYRLLSGTPGARLLRELIAHTVNHSSYHRGQIADMLRRLGVKPPSTDLLEFTGL